MQLIIQLDGILPAIWRRIVVLDTATLAQLHRVIQRVMPWQNSHLHEFEVQGQRYGMPDPEDEDLRDERRLRLAQLAVGSRFIYRYDFGDNWTHRITVESAGDEAQTALLGGKLARCLDGKRAAPPEDCVGPPGYQELLRALGDPAHPRHAEYRHWLGRPWDAEEFNNMRCSKPMNIVIE